MVTKNGEKSTGTESRLIYTDEQVGLDCKQTSYKNI